MSSILAFLDYTDSNLVSIAYEVLTDPDELKEDLNISQSPMDLEIFRGHSFETQGDALRCSCKLAVKFEIRIPSASDGEEGCLIARGSCAMTGAAECQIEEEDEEMQQQVLAANVISYLWAKMRDWIELVSQAGPLGRVSLPAVDPFALLDKSNAVEENEDD